MEGVIERLSDVLLRISRVYLSNSGKMGRILEKYGMKYDGLLKNVKIKPDFRKGIVEFYYRNKIFARVEIPKEAIDRSSPDLYNPVFKMPPSFLALALGMYLLGSLSRDPLIFSLATMLLVVGGKYLRGALDYGIWDVITKPRIEILNKDLAQKFYLELFNR